MCFLYIFERRQIKFKFYINCPVPCFHQKTSPKITQQHSLHIKNLNYIYIYICVLVLILRLFFLYFFYIISKHTDVLFYGFRIDLVYSTEKFSSSFCLFCYLQCLTIVEREGNCMLMLLIYFLQIFVLVSWNFLIKKNSQQIFKFLFFFVCDHVCVCVCVCVW